MNNLREKFNSSVAETVADLNCNRKLDDNLDDPDSLIRERGDIMRTLTNPIKLHNVTDTARNIPSDIANGYVRLMKAHIELTRAVLMGTGSVLRAQLAPVTNIGNRLATNVRNNQ